MAHDTGVHPLFAHIDAALVASLDPAAFGPGADTPEGRATHVALVAVGVQNQAPAYPRILAACDATPLGRDRIRRYGAWSATEWVMVAPRAVCDLLESFQVSIGTGYQLCWHRAPTADPAALRDALVAIYAHERAVSPDRLRGDRMVTLDVAECLVGVSARTGVPTADLLQLAFDEPLAAQFTRDRFASLEAMVAAAYR